ncbi:MAG TPA: C40 family peptidase [Candidatus Competibacteraceae bacterium]|nr:C40 family peptidase [Candidatus Competibacteraceae bacterium]HPF57483.1 C40 family peptidase [Candidatus Competibacteraceae bacterium]HRY17189.1 C40 family peptidase [Candidatus Competibacteraceae bacterium]
MPILPPANRFNAVLLLLAGLSWLGGCATPPVSTHDPDGAVRQRILAAADRLIGTPYVLGGESPAGVDCSGLVQYAYLQAGIQLPRTSVEQFEAAQPQRRVLPGDLLFFRTGRSSQVSHVGIYAGNGQMIHASSGSRKVRKVKLNQRYWRQHMIGGATFLGAGGVPVARRGAVSGKPSSS